MIDLTPSRRDTKALTVAPEWTTAIQARYGNTEKMLTAFGVNNQRYCALNTERALRGGVPSMARMCVTYGDAIVAGLLTGHLTAAVDNLGEDRDMTDGDIRRTAMAMCDIERVRLLNFSSVIGFFYRLRNGEFEIFGKMTPRKILEAMQRYAHEQHEYENRLRRRIETEATEAAEAERLRQSTPWAVIARRAGLSLERYPTMGHYCLAVVSGAQRELKLDLSPATPEELAL